MNDAKQVSTARTCRRLRLVLRGASAAVLSGGPTSPSNAPESLQTDLRAIAMEGVRPQVDSTAWVAPNSVVIGNVRLAPCSSVWFGCTLRGDNSSITIGENSNIQENSVLHCDDAFPLSVGSNCTIGHLVMLHGCQIGDNCLVGMGAVVLNGVTVGSGSLIGAGALIPEGKTIPCNSLVLGSPGKVVRQTNERDWAMIRHGVEFYQHNALRFRKELEDQEHLRLAQRDNEGGGAGIGSQLEKLWALKVSGALTDAEYATTKASLISALQH